MSSMQLQVHVRFPLGKVDDVQEAYDKVVPMFGKDPDDVDIWNNEVMGFYYKADQNDGFTVNRPENKLFIDYVITDKSDDDLYINYDFAIGEENDQLTEIVNKYKERFGEPEATPRLRIFYFYNGGCYGLGEVI